MRKEQIGRIEYIRTDRYELPEKIKCLKCGCRMVYSQYYNQYECTNAACGNWILAADFVEEELTRAKEEQEKE